MKDRASVSRGARWAGRFLILCGGIGIVAGVVPLAINVARMLGHQFGQSTDDWAAHGVEAMGMGLPWAALSSSDGTFLGGLLLAAGIGWLRGRAWAPLVTFLYAVDGIMVTGIDLLSFASVAKPGRMRSSMLALDGVAFALAVSVLVAMIAWRRRRILEQRSPAC